MIFKSKSLSLLACAIFMNSCLTVTADHLEKISPSQLKTKNVQKVKIFSRWSADVSVDFQKEQVEVMKAALYKHAFEKNLKSLDCCQLVEGPTEADVIVEGKAFEDPQTWSLFFALLTGVTLYIVPSWAKGEINMEVKVSEKGNERSYKLYDSFTLVQWLPFIVAVPFQPSLSNVADTMTENAYFNLLSKMQKDGFLGAVSPST